MNPEYAPEKLNDAAHDAGLHFDDLPDDEPPQLSEPPDYGEAQPSDEPTPNKERFGRLALLHDRIKNRTPTPWVISEAIPDKGLTFLHALPKVGKSFLAIDWAVSIASGQDWQGRKVEKQGGVIYVSGEGNSAIDDRFLACCNYRGVQIDSLKLAISDSAYRLPKDKRELIRDVKDMAARIGIESVSAVFFDTYRRTLIGDMNSNEHAALWVAAADEIKSALDCAVVVVHHTLRGSDRMGGAQTLEASHDSLFYLTEVNQCADGLSKRVLLTHQEVKDGARIKPIGLVLQHATLDGVPTDGGFDGDEAATLVVVRDPDGVTYPDRKSAKSGKSGKGGNQQEALAILVRLESENRAKLTEMKYPPDGAGVLEATWEAACKKANLFRHPSEFDKRIYKPLVDTGQILPQMPYIASARR